MLLPRLYAILDAACFPSGDALFTAADELASAGCTLLQYRNKQGSARQMLEQARELKKRLDSHPNVLHDPITPKSGVLGTPVAKNATLGWGTRGLVRLIMNDRADLCVAAGFDGLHVGQDDLSPEAARRIIGSEYQGKARWLGVSTHNPEQLVEGDKTPADYLAIGPVFATSSKVNPDPVVGLEGVRRARELTRKPLVAIGGITRTNARAVIEAGADAVAVISDLLRDPGKSAEEFLRVLG